MTTNGIPVPEQTLSQRMQSLALANKTRVRLKELKREVRQADGLPAGCHHVAALLRDQDRIAGIEGRIRIYEALQAIPRIGEITVGRLYRKAEVVNPARRLDQMSVRQRELLAVALDERAHWYGKRSR